MQMLFMPDIRVTPMQMLDAKNVNVMVLEKVRHTGFCQFVAVNEDFALVDGWDELKAWRSLGFTHVHGTVMANRAVQSDSHVRLGKPDFTGFHREQSAQINNAFNEGVRHGIQLQERKEYAQIEARFKEVVRVGTVDTGYQPPQVINMKLGDIGREHKCTPEVEALIGKVQRFHSRQADQLIENLMGHLNALLTNARNVGRDDAKREIVERLKGVVD